LANWFGVQNILCSKDCVDVYNPKVVQATMGALMRVKVHYVDLQSTITDLTKFTDFQIYGTFMEGNSIYESKLDNNGLLIMGNEGKGISEKTLKNSTISYKDAIDAIDLLIKKKEYEEYSEKIKNEISELKSKIDDLSSPEELKIKFIEKLKTLELL